MCAQQIVCNRYFLLKKKKVLLTSAFRKIVNKLFQKKFNTTIMKNIKSRK